MARLIIILWLVLLGSHSYAQKNLQVDSSSVTFVIKNAGLPVNGSFSGLQAKIDFHPNKLDSSLMIASIDAGSIETGIRIRNNHLRRSDYFHVDSFPRITLKSVSFQKKGEGQFLGVFILYLKGREGKISVPFSFKKEETNYIFNGSFEINRSDYDIGDTSLLSILLSDKVHINIWVKVRE
jgi:polyisoprenoid-binding protein YceI